MTEDTTPIPPSLPLIITHPTDGDSIDCIDGKLRRNDHAWSDPARWPAYGSTMFATYLRIGVSNHCVRVWKIGEKWPKQRPMVIEGGLGFRIQYAGEDQRPWIPYPNLARGALDTMKLERDAAIDARNEVQRQRGRIRVERDKAIEERDKAIADLVGMGRKRDQVIEERNKATDERDKAIDERDQAIDERDKAIAERDQAIEEENARQWIKDAKLIIARFVKDFG